MGFLGDFQEQGRFVKSINANFPSFGAKGRKGCRP